MTERILPAEHISRRPSPRSFRDVLQEILTRRDLSASQLAILLEYKSKTTLARVIQGKAGLRCIGNVYKDLLRCEELHLTEAENEKLHVAYQVELWGLENYRARDEMWRLLRRQESSVQTLHLLCSDGSEISFRAFLDQFVPLGEGSAGIPAEKVSVWILNGCLGSVMTVLPSLLDRMNSRADILHAIQLTGDTARTIRLIRNLMPALGYHQYEAYSIPSMELSDDQSGLVMNSCGGNVILLRVCLSDGGVREFQILLRSNTSGVLLEAPGVWEQWNRFMEPYREARQPIKAPNPVVTDYAALLETYAENERNREMYTYKGDVCMDHIPTDILIRAIEESDTAAEFAGEMDVIRQTLNRLQSIQEKRFHNALTRRHHTHWVAKEGALKRFAETGMQQDHFFAMRPFTIPERERIFRHLLDQVKNNPYFHLYLLQKEDEARFVSLEATYLDGIGLQLTSLGTDYCLAESYTETMLTQEDFCGLFREFFREELIAHHTRPVGETERVLEEILRSLQ